MELTKIRGLEELYEIELLKVMDNINDLKTESKKTRTIKIEISLTPKDEDRELLDIRVKTSSKLESNRAVIDTVYQKNGKITEIPKGEPFPFGGNKITSFGGVK